MAEKIKSIFGETAVVNGKGEKISVDSLCGDGKYVGIYFSAHWCPPCRQFTPVLSDFYKALEAKKVIEIVFVSSDKDEEAWKKYFGDMPWLALDFSDRAKKDALCQEYGVRGIPTFVILDGNTGEIAYADGRSEVSNDTTGEKFPWPRK